MCRNATLQTIRDLGPAVVQARGNVILLRGVALGLGARLAVDLEVAVTRRRAGGLGAEDAVVDHLLDLALGAVLGRGPRRRHRGVAGALARVVLEHARVDDGVLGGGDADAALGLLHDDGEDEAGVELAAAGGLGDGRLQLVVLGVAVGGHAVGAALLDERQVGAPHAVEARHPLVHGGPAGAGRAVAFVEFVRVFEARAAAAATAAGGGGWCGGRGGRRGGVVRVVGLVGAGAGRGSMVVLRGAAGRGKAGWDVVDSGGLGGSPAVIVGAECGGTLGDGNAGWNERGHCF